MVFSTPKLLTTEQYVPQYVPQ